MNVIYTTPDEMFRVVEKDGLFFPQEHVVSCPAYCGGRLYNIALIAQLQESPLFSKSVHDQGWYGFYTGYKQFSTIYKGDKSYKSAKPAIAYVNRLSENAQAA